MSDPADYVDVLTVRGSATLNEADYATAMIPSFSATWPERSREYRRITSVASDFAVTTPEYLAAQRYFGQNPAPRRLKIGRFANKPTIVYSLGIGAANSYVYKVTVYGPFAPTGVEVSFTSDANATTAEIAAGLVIALNAVPSKNYTASGSDTPVLLTANTAGAWFTVEVSDADRKAARFTLATTHADPGVTADLTALADEDSAWYFLYMTHSSPAIAAAVQVWQAARGVGFADIDTDCTLAATAVLAAGGNDVMDAAKTAAYGRSYVTFHRNLGVFPGLAYAATKLVLAPGSETWHGGAVTLVPSMNLSDTERARIVSKYGASFETLYSTVRQFGGRVASGEWIDVVRGLDKLNADIQYAVFVAQTQPRKVPLTAGGLNTLKGVIEACLKVAQDAGILDPDYATTVFVPDISDLTPEQIAEREVTIEWEGRLAGAIHKTLVRGTVQA